MNESVLHETTARSLAGTMPFPEVVRVLSEEGVESYRVDLVLGQKTFYHPDGRSVVGALEYRGPRPAAKFSAGAVVEAILASQSRAIDYRTFLGRILAAGVTGYAVYLQGRKAVYVGRNGDFHVEHFPPAP